MIYDPMTPIWLQVATELKREIVTGKIQPGEKLPGGRDLALRKRSARPAGAWEPL